MQKVPASVSVLSDLAIEDAGITSTRDIQSKVPNMKTAHSGSRGYFSRISIRGMSNTGIGDPAVALYIDDIPYSDLFIFNTPLYDIERIEVLKGPQGTLYGKNTEAGAISIVTKRAGNDFEARVGAEAGDYDFYTLKGHLNTPIVKDKLFFRLSALKSERDGYIDNVYNGGQIDKHDTASGRGSLVFTPNERLDVNLSLATARLNDGGFPMVPKDKEIYRNAAGLSSLGKFQAAVNHEGKSITEDDLAALRIKYGLGNMDLVSITGYRSNDNDLTLDGDFTPKQLTVGFNTRKSHALTQELRVMSKPDERFKWLGGLFYSDETVDNKTGYRLDETYARMQGLPLYAEDAMIATLDNKDAAVFGQAALRFFDDAFGVTAGLRYDRSHRHMDRSHTFMGKDNVPPVNGMERTDSKFLPKLALDYGFTEAVTGYASYARGYKAGGFSYAVDDADLAKYNPETADAFEIGVKSEFPELGLRINLAAFYSKIQDYQDRVQINPMAIVQANATQVDSYGAEMEAAWRISPALTLDTVFGYTHAEYGDYMDPMTGENYKGRRVSLIPEYDLALGLQYRNALGIMGRVDLHHAGTSWLDRGNSAEQKPYTTLNVKLGYERETWDVYLAVNNITDEEYFLDAFKTRDAGYMGTVGDPRTIRIMANIRF
ncbi:MAG: TonB-dependent receptor [Desulfobacterales bacterium]|nr:TonB-dependent receptor [Desulfobacterales bacterium]